MKKLSKLRIIEEGRICSEEQNRIRGGCNPYTTCTSGYTSCGTSSLTSCQPSATHGYSDDGEGNIYCNKDYSYVSCSSATDKESCPSTASYKNL